ncbi:MAG: serine/threonine protein kinase, partial [Nocardiopsaceae bacterium]|nr:serine/threonine protein kinase [Nocardiopsaceae bacterium]
MTAPDGTAGLPGDVPGCRVLETVGRGGFGVVYRARQERLGRDVAIKMLTVPGLGDEAVARFRREAELLARLTGHPNVVTVLDSGVTRSGLPYLVMPFFEQGSLADRLAREGPLPVGEVLQAGVKIAGALAAAHQEGILHRDVKPQNILVSRYGEPALADFGIARLLDQADAATRSGALTPDHAAPEVLDGQPYGIPADVYSLGSTLHQLLAGRPPFRLAADEGLAPLLLRILTEPPPAIPRPDVPPALADALRTALAKQPAERFQQASDFAARLREAQAGLPAAGLAQVPAVRQPASDAGWPRPDGADAASAAPGTAAGWRPTPPDPDLAETPDLAEAGRPAGAAATGGAGRDETIARPGRAPRAAPGAPGRSPGRRRRVAAMAAAAVI